MADPLDPRTFGLPPEVLRVGLQQGKSIPQIEAEWTAQNRARDFAPIGQLVDSVKNGLGNVFSGAPAAPTGRTGVRADKGRAPVGQTINDTFGPPLATLFNSEQNPNEPNAAHLLRRGPAAIYNLIKNNVTDPAIAMASSTPQLLASGGDTPASRDQRMRAADVMKPAGAPAGNKPVGTLSDQLFAVIKEMGGTPTSGARSPAKNAKVDGVTNSFHLTAEAADSIPPKGVTMSAWYKVLKSRFPGMDVINEGDHVHVEPRGTPGRKIMGAVDDMGGFQNPFDPAYANQAMGQIGVAEQQALKPFSTTTDVGMAPEMPAPILAPKTDFTKSDEALERLRPIEMAEKEKLSIRRGEWLAGIGQAMMSLQDGAGLGKVLGAMGGGALAGAARGDREVLNRMDAFEEKMARFNAAQLTNETNKAQTARAEAQADANALNATAMAKFNVAYDGWKSNKNITVTPTAIISNIYDSKTGQVTTKSVPIAGAIKSAFAMQKAQMLGQISGDYNAGNRMVAQANNSLIMGVAAQAAASGQDGGEDAMLQAPAFLITEMVSQGGLPRALGPEGFKSLSQEGMKALAAMGLQQGTAAYIDAMNEYMATEAFQLFHADGGFRKQVLDSSGMVQSRFLADRYRSAKTTTRTTPKGSTFTRQEGD